MKKSPAGFVELEVLWGEKLPKLKLYYVKYKDNRLPPLKDYDKAVQLYELIAESSEVHDAGNFNYKGDTNADE